MVAPARRLTPEGRRRFRENRAREREETVRFLRGSGCAACRAGEDARGYWTSAYINETHTDADVTARVRRSLGLCPAHTRVLIADASESWITPSLFLDALNQGLALMDGGGPSPLGCPVCENVARAERTSYERIRRNIAEPEVRGAYVEAGGLCLPHTVGLLAALPAGQAGVVVETALARLDTDEPTVTMLAGVDEDAAARAALLRPGMLPAEEAALERSQATLLRRDLRAGSCPLCRRYVRTSYRYLRWLVAGDGSTRPVAEDAILCARHLHEVVRVDAAAADWALAQARGQWITRFRRFRDRLAELPSGRFRGEGKAYQGLAAWLADVPGCRACAAADGAVERTRKEIGVAVRDALAVAALGRAHGVCVRHGLAWHGPGADRVREVTVARAAAMAFELSELLRKNSWSTRFEARGAETTAERRAPTLLDGRVYGGLSAREADFGNALTAASGTDAVRRPPRPATPKSGPVRARSRSATEGSPIGGEAAADRGAGSVVPEDRDAAGAATEGGGAGCRVEGRSTANASEHGHGQSRDGAA